MADAGDLYRWGLWGPFDFISSMAQETASFSPTLSLYLISIIKYVCYSLPCQSFQDD